MKSLDRLRRAHRAEVLRLLGIDTDIPRVFVAQAKSLLDEVDLMRLPIDMTGVPVASTLGRTVDVDGLRSFVIGMDPIGGPYPI